MLTGVVSNIFARSIKIEAGLRISGETKTRNSDGVLGGGKNFGAQATEAMSLEPCAVFPVVVVGRGNAKELTVAGRVAERNKK